MQGTPGARHAPAIELRKLTKRFGELTANDSVDLIVERGTIHGLVGENGAGKSTAMKMLYGIHRPDSGEIRVNGEVQEWKTPLDAIHAGIGMVHQHFMLAEPYSALDNILLGVERTWGADLPFARVAQPVLPIDRARARVKLDELARRHGLPVDWDAPVESLPVGVQQRIEILKLLFRKAEILILDEPTAVLTPQETQSLFAQLRELKAEGKTIIIITHKLGEVMSLTDRVTVFRAGRVTGGAKTSETTPQELANLMVGRKVLLGTEVPAQGTLGAPVLEVKGLGLAGARSGGREEQGRERARLSGLSLSVHAGEIVGIAGVEGNGQSELLQALLHPSDRACRSEGSVHVLGEDVSSWPSRKIRALGVGVIPEDRHREGLLLEQSLEENFMLGLQDSPPFAKRGVLDVKAARAAASRALDEFDVRPRDVTAIAGRLSGGNQQKLIIAREFFRKPKLLIAAQPTRGVDVGAIEFIHRRIVELARSGAAGVLLVSSELEEVISLSDRILVFFEGRIAGEFKRGQVSEREIGLRMGGGGGEAAS